VARGKKREGQSAMGVKYVAAAAPGRKRMKRRDPTRDRRSTPRLMTDNAGIIWKPCPIHRSRSASRVIALIGLTDTPAKQIACERRSYGIDRCVRRHDVSVAIPTRRKRISRSTLAGELAFACNSRSQLRFLFPRFRCGFPICFDRSIFGRFSRPWLLSASSIVASNPRRIVACTMRVIVKNGFLIMGTLWEHYGNVKFAV